MFYTVQSFAIRKQSYSDSAVLHHGLVKIDTQTSGRVGELPYAKLLSRVSYSEDVKHSLNSGVDNCLPCLDRVMTNHGRVCFEVDRAV